MNRRERIEDALRRYAERTAPPAQPVCARCKHPERLHAEVGEWCARCGASCSFVREGSRQADPGSQDAGEAGAEAPEGGRRR